MILNQHIEETDKWQQEESECLAKAVMLQSLFPSQLVVLVISRLCFSSHIFMFTYSNGASAILKLQLTGCVLAAQAMQIKF